tara:strand:- start:340 stop:1221 length:882 start_codon:yes stop_codon:yes gene_type:complete
MAKLGVKPTHKTVADIKGTILSPSLTPYFEVQFPVPSFLSDLNSGTTSPYNYLTLLCTEAVLPGNSLATFNVDNDYTGVTEKMPHRKVYDQDLKLTFYVNAGESSYYPIRFFESYISHIAGEDPSDSESLTRLRNQNYYYRMSFPDDYMIDGLIIKKFEKGGKWSKDDPSINHVDTQLQYEFIRTYPTAINSMPVAYGNVDVLKCTVSYSYIRYVQYNTFSTKRKAADPANILPSLEPTVEENPKPPIYTPYEKIKKKESDNKIKDPTKGSFNESGVPGKVLFPGVPTLPFLK